MVVVLALAAVFGSMSLANPAMAAFGQPADAELTERVDSPQVRDSVDIVEGGSEVVDLTEHLPNGVTDVEATGHTVTNDTPTAVDVADTDIAVNRNTVDIEITALADQAGERARLTITIDRTGTGADDNTVILLTVNVIEAADATAAITVGTLADQEVDAGAAGATGPEKSINVARYFANGEGTRGEITGYAAVEVGADGVELDAAAKFLTAPIAVDGEEITLQADADAVAGNFTRVRISATDSVGVADPAHIIIVDVVEPGTATGGGEASLVPGSYNPGSNTSYTITFAAPTGGITPGSEDIVVKFTEDDWQVPSSIDEATVSVSFDDGTNDISVNPASVNVDDQEVELVLGDLNGDAAGVGSIDAATSVTVLFRPSAGISNPTEGKTYGDMEVAGIALNDITIRRTIGIDPEDGGLGEVVTATGKGFKNDTTLTVFMDANRNGVLNAGEDVLCAVPSIGGDDVGKCEFTVNHPTFATGAVNYINAVDGLNNDAYEIQTFELTESVMASPDSGSPGELMLVQVVDFDDGSVINSVTLGGMEYCGTTGGGACGWRVDNNGSASFNLTVPNWARAGIQRLEVKSNTGDSANTNVTISGPQISVTPESVLANQRISLLGVGFSANAMIGRENDGRQDSKVSVGGEDIMWGRLNGGDPVDVDSGGNWSASLDLPLSAATTGAGERVIRITDSMNRTGVVIVDIPERTVTITPESGRVGTIAVVRGTGFPSKNDEGSSFNIDIVYDAGNDKETTVSALPDASGRFEVQLRIPTTASIPSTNTVRVSFEDDANMAIVTNVAHAVPEGIIELSATSGGPGTTLTIDGEGFKSFVPIRSVKIGTLEITPAPRPNTDGNGMMSFDVTIPGLDVGIQTIEVSVGQTTASTGFTVTESGVNPGDIKPTAQAIEELGENLVSVWHFNNDTKVWSFYDPNLAEGNTLTHMISGETYLIRVQSTVEVILNNDTRSLTCVGGNCWNQVVW